MMGTIYITEFNTPYGTLILGDNEGRLCLCDWKNRSARENIDRSVQKHLNARYQTAASSLIRTTISQLEEFFAGSRQAFTVPLVFPGTPFRQSVWRALGNIPYGITITYEELSVKLGNPGALRAVSAAVGANPLSILIPCHRVIGKTGNLTGYAGGIEVKRSLLSMERRNAPQIHQELTLNI